MVERVDDEGAAIWRLVGCACYLRELLDNLHETSSQEDDGVDQSDDPGVVRTGVALSVLKAELSGEGQIGAVG